MPRTRISKHLRAPSTAQRQLLLVAFFVRDNLPLEMHMANNNQSEGRWTRSEHPGNDPEAMRRFQQRRLWDSGEMKEGIDFLREPRPVVLLGISWARC